LLDRAGVRDQHLADREDYIESIEEALWDQDEDDTGEITVGHVKIAFTTFDADKPPEEVPLYDVCDHS